jgi:hypothetical protein
MDSLEAWLRTMFLFFSANTYDPQRLRTRLHDAPKQIEDFRARFVAVLRDRPLTPDDWERHMDFDFDSTDELYEHLQAIYDFLFEDGPFPNGPH